MKKTLFVHTILSFVYAQHLLAITLDIAVLNMLRTNPEIKDKQHGLEVIQSEEGIIESDFYPKIDLSTGIGKAKQKTTPSYNTQTGDLVRRTDTSITARMNLFNGLRTYYDSNSLEHKIEAENFYIKEHKANMIMKVVEGYINLTKQKSIVKINKENVLFHEQFYKKLKELTDSGLGRVSDLKLASGRLALAKINAVVHENNFIQTKMDFETILGSTITIDDLKEPYFEYKLPESLQLASETAISNNPSIKSSEENIKSAYNTYKKNQSSYWPSIDIELKKSRFDEEGNYNYTVESSYGMVYLTYNIFNGFADSSSTQKEFSFYLQNKEFLNYIKRDTVKKLGISWIAAIKIKEQLALLESMKKDSKSTLDDYYEEYLFGRRTILDIINVKNDYDNSRQSYESAKYDLLLSKFKILNAMGTLESYFEQRINNLENITDVDFVEDQSVNEIVSNMSSKLESNKEFIKLDSSEFNTTLTSNISENDSQEDISDLFE